MVVSLVYGLGDGMGVGARVGGCDGSGQTEDNKIAQDGIQLHKSSLRERQFRRERPRRASPRKTVGQTPSENRDQKLWSAPFKATLHYRSLGGVVEPIHQVVERLLRRSLLAIRPDYLRPIPATPDFEYPRIYWLRKSCSVFACDLARNLVRLQPDG